MTTSPWLIVGLGNPGPKYAGNRHNIGYLVVEELASRAAANFQTQNLRSTKPHVAVGRAGMLPGGAPGPRVVLVKTGTYMNVSGGPVSAVAQYYGIPPEQIIAVHDELDIPFAKLRLKSGGGEGGHNGLRSMSSSLGTKNYLRVRVGVDRPSGRQDPADYVLSDFNSTERKELPFLIHDAADAVELIITQGLEQAQLKVHTANN